MLLPDRYDDGGISGGTLERPALQKMLADIEAGRIDIVVVYKVDRLTRSLLDFAKLVEVFDKARTSFVSVTQSFNTTTSMGRLTLNMPLSFAQFEREVTAERIRDKLAASKQRGMWMGGTPPLGYEPNGRSLAIVEEHAELVRLIFELYLGLGNVRRLQNELDCRGITKPIRISKAGRTFGGTSFSRGELYAILSNPIYIGQIRHKDTTYDGLHQPIIDHSPWAEVQAAIVDNRTGERHIRAVVHPSILAGKLFDATGERMVASHASKGARRYRYYVSANLQHGGDAANTDGMRIPASEIETLVANKLAELFDDPIALMEQLSASASTSSARPAESIAPLERLTALASPEVTAKAVAESRTVTEILNGSDPASVVRLVDRIVQRVDVTSDAVTIILDSQQIAERLRTMVAQSTIAGSRMGASRVEGEASSASLQITIPAKLKRSGWEMRLILPSGETASARVDDRLVRAIATAHQWWDEFVQNPGLRLTDLAAAHNVTESWITRTLRLAFLDPAIVEQALVGRAPAHLSPEVLRSPDSVPALWSAQRARHRIAIAR